MEVKKLNDLKNILEKNLDFLQNISATNFYLVEILSIKDIMNIIQKVFSTEKFKTRIVSNPNDPYLSLSMPYRIGEGNMTELIIIIDNEKVIDIGADAYPEDSWVLSIKICPEVIIDFQYEEKYDKDIICGVAFIETYKKGDKNIVREVVLDYTKDYKVIRILDKSVPIKSIFS